MRVPVSVASFQGARSTVETDRSLTAYLALLRLIDDNERHVNVVVCESDYRALKRGIEQLPPGVQ
jgi:hypothetical protein